MTIRVTSTAVHRELSRVLRLAAWLHPSLAKEVFRLAYQEAQRREKLKLTQMFDRAHCQDVFEERSPSSQPDCHAIASRVSSSAPMHEAVGQ